MNCFDSYKTTWCDMYVENHREKSFRACVCIIRSLIFWKSWCLIWIMTSLAQHSQKVINACSIFFKDRTSHEYFKNCSSLKMRILVTEKFTKTRNQKFCSRFISWNIVRIISIRIYMETWYIKKSSFIAKVSDVHRSI